MSEIHPSGRKTELIWEGKYDANGRSGAPLRVYCPFRRLRWSTIHHRDDRRRLSLFESPSAYLAKEWRNRLIWGDKRYVLPALLVFGCSAAMIRGFSWSSALRELATFADQ